MSPHRAYVVHVLRALFGITVLVAALSLVDLGATRAALQAIDAVELFAAFALSIAATILVPAIVTSQTLRVGQLRLPLSELARINLAMRFYVLTLPHAVTVGIRWLKYRNMNPGLGSHVAALILFERMIQFLVVVGSGFLFMLLTRESVPSGLWVLMPLSALLTIFGGVASLAFLSEFVFRHVRRLSRVVAVRVPRILADRARQFMAAISEYQQLGNRRVALILFWVIMGQLLFVGSAFVVARGLGLGLGFAQIGWMRSVVLLLTILPITVGGIGVREAGFGALLYLHGVTGPSAVAMPLVLLAIQLCIGLIGAAIEGVSMLKTRGGTDGAGIQG